jgi:carbonic anhydrase
MDSARRDVLKGMAVGTAGLALSTIPDSMVLAGAGGKKGYDVGKPISPDKAIGLLKAGNERYMKMNRQRDPGVGPNARQPLTQGQWPYATILCCSDSRVPPEIVFDEGLGRLFIVRIAGNFINPDLLGSIEYASMHSTSRLVLVMSHEFCGAVGAAVSAFENPGFNETAGINSIVNKLMPAVMLAKKETNLSGKALIEAASKKNVQLTVEQIAQQSENLRKMQRNRELKIIGGYYSLKTGKVDIWT